MEMWELVRRLLAGANGGGQSFTPGLIGDLYRRDLIAAKQDAGLTYQEVLEFADCLSEQMQKEGLIRPAGVRGKGPAILGAMERTELGEELYDAIRGHNVVMFFEGMNADVEAPTIRRLLYQLNS
ncbi:hypothetical protein [Pseudomonas sp. S1Bt23]|jgi:hypothetical protein|uniref:hypothetical protein n=1 Tax=Pseudomonas sp. S1Bt23 TaxID=3095074 RepID=UPI002A5ADBEC|nr:hypothetical protein [Pseudomonas sp. S1Bt23]WPO49549.1 hypothetical protein SHB59_10990 [Pseudomonas sp. S1Bt23]